MKKRNTVLIGAILAVTIIVIWSFSYSMTRTRQINTSTENNNEIDDSLISILYETYSGSGEYILSEDREFMKNWVINEYYYYYVFNEDLSRCENGSEISYDQTNGLQLTTHLSDKCYIYFDRRTTIGEKCAYQNMANCIKENIDLTTLYDVNGKTTYYHNATLENGANDKSIRFTGGYPNNYVCFGTDVSTCPSDNLYRIIGLFDDDNDGNYQMKLIKDTSLGKYYWSGSSTNTSNTWSNSTLNTDVLNKTYLNNFDEKWQNMISTTSWYVGGVKYSTIDTNTAKQFLDEEKSTTTKYDAKIGLMYLSDYAYAASSNYWAVPTSNYDYYNITLGNEFTWLHTDQNEWTIDRDSKYDDYAVVILNDGILYSYDVNGLEAAVRPTFYLDPNVIMDISMTYDYEDYGYPYGSYYNPFRIAK